MATSAPLVVERPSGTVWDKRVGVQMLNVWIWWSRTQLVVDWSGVFKADIGIKDGFIVGIGKAGNPDIIDGVDPAIIVGSNTDVFAGEGKIVTAGGIDTHVHFICPHQAGRTHKPWGDAVKSSFARGIQRTRTRSNVGR